MPRSLHSLLLVLLLPTVALLHGCATQTWLTEQGADAPSRCRIGLAPVDGKSASREGTARAIGSLSTSAERFQAGSADSTIDKMLAECP